MSIVEKLIYRLEKFLLAIHNLSSLTKQAKVNGVTIKHKVSTWRELSRIANYTTKEPYTLQWIDDQVKTNDVFYDIGANIGQYSLYAAAQKGAGLRVFCFEPEAQNFARLFENIYLNGWGNRIVPFCLAVSNRTSVSRLDLHGAPQAGEAMHQVIAQEEETLNHIGEQGIIEMSLDDLIYAHNLPFPNCMKIDVDGHEEKIIAGAGKTLGNHELRTINIEISQEKALTKTPTQIEVQLAEFGFRETGRFRMGHSDPNMVSHNVIYVRE